MFECRENHVCKGPTIKGKTIFFPLSVAPMSKEITLKGHKIEKPPTLHNPKISCVFFFKMANFDAANIKCVTVLLIVAVIHLFQDMPDVTVSVMKHRPNVPGLSRTLQNASLFDSLTFMMR